MKKTFWAFLTLFLFFGIALGSYTIYPSIHQIGVIKFSQESSPDLSAPNSSNLSNSDNFSPEPIYLRTIADTRNDFILNGANFLEINLSAMKVKLYQDGQLIKEVPILTIGDPKGWGGSAVGVYKIISGNKLSFSTISRVYMPYALHYYGKYYLHGEPYYPDGRKLTSPVSGGCIRLSNKDAKDIYNLTTLNLPVVVVDKEKDHYQYQALNKESSDFPKISAESYLVADIDSGFVFAEKNSKEKLPIASLTKLITALVVSENVDLRKSILVKPEMLEAYGTTEELEVGKRLRVVELFYPLLIESSNDAAEVLSHFLGRENTIAMMNEKSKEILMKDTKFVDPHGLSLKNVSTAEDIFQLARYILNNRPPFLEITKGQEVLNFGELSFDSKKLRNKNVFFNDPSFIGGKTGYLRQSKHTAVFIFKFITNDKNNRSVVIILLGSDNIKDDTQKIREWLKENYSLLPES